MNNINLFNRRNNIILRFFRAFIFVLVLAMFPISYGFVKDTGVSAADTKEEYRAKYQKNLEKVYKTYKKAYYTSKQYKKLTKQYNNGVKAIKDAKSKSAIKKAYKTYKEKLNNIKPSILVKYQGTQEKSLLKSYNSLISKYQYSKDNLNKLETIKDEALVKVYKQKTKTKAKKVRTKAFSEMKKVEKIVSTGNGSNTGNESSQTDTNTNTGSQTGSGNDNPGNGNSNTGSGSNNTGNGSDNTQTGDNNFEFGLVYKSVDVTPERFPDDTLRAVVLQSFDTDRNGTLDSDEIIYARNLWCVGAGIKSLEGIEYLPELRGIYCMDNEIEALDISQNQQLTGLWCSGNKLKSLDLTKNANLEWVYCFDNQLTELDVSKNPKMSFIECNTNPITELDLSHNPELEHLTCGSCELSELDLSHNPKLAHLDAFRNHFKTLDVSHNPKLKRIDVWDNPDLGTIDLSNNPGVQYYNCAHNNVTKLDVSNLPELTSLNCAYNRELTALDVTHNPKLSVLHCEDCAIGELDISKNPKLYYLYAAINRIEKLDIGYNPFLLKGYNEGTYKEEWYGHSWTIEFGGDTSTGVEDVITIWVNSDVEISAESKGVVPTIEKYSELDPGVSEADLVTREQVAEALYEMAGKPDVSGLKTRFTDVDPAASYYDAIVWGEANSICVGYPDAFFDSFGVGKYITRQDLLFMLMRYSEFTGYKRDIDFGRADDFSDYYDVDYEHWEAVTWNFTWLIMDAKGDQNAPKEEQRIDPYGRVTKDELKKVLARFIEVNS